jgi:hypothetical protein
MKFPCNDLLLNMSKVFRSISWWQKIIAGQKVTTKLGSPQKLEGSIRKKIGNKCHKINRNIP